MTLDRLKAALNEAIDEGVVRKNVALRVKIPRWARKEARKKRKQDKPYTEDEVRIFLKKNAGKRLIAIANLSLMGMRPAEVCGAKWSEVDWGSFGEFCQEHDRRWCRDCFGISEDYVLPSIPTDNTRTLVDGEVEEKDAKSEAGNRRLPLAALIAFALHDFLVLQRKERELVGEAYEYSGYILVDELGRPQKTDWLRRQMHKMMAYASLRKTRLYNCRHSCLTYLATQGVHPSLLAAWAGHADGGELAMKIYVQPDLKHLAGTSRTLNGLFV